MKPAFIAFSDIQIEDWRRYSIDHSRFKAHDSIFKKIIELCTKYKCPAIFCGDLFDNNEQLSNYVLTNVFGWFNDLKNNNIEVFAISGNHDQSESNDYSHRGPNYIQMMASIYWNFHDIDFKTLYIGDYSISGIPYITGNRDYPNVVKKLRKELRSGYKHILLTHTDMPGLTDTSGRQIDSAENIPIKLKKFFKGFDLVLNGHIHKPQKTRSNIITLGATHQQRSSDIGQSMGIWKIYPDLGTKFVRVKTPRFVEVDAIPENPDPGKLYIEKAKPENQEAEELQELRAFRSEDKKKIAKAFMRAIGIKSKKKLNLLIKYLNAGN